MSEDKLVECDNCQDEFDDDEVCHVACVSMNLCDDCRDELTFTCTICDYLSDCDEMVAVGDEIMCQGCADDNVSTCGICGKQILNDDSMYVENSCEYYCQDCFYNNFFTCEICEGVVDRGYGYHHNDYMYCEYCYEQQRENQDIRDWNYSPTIRFYAGNSNTRTAPKRGIATYGTEVELIVTGGYDDALDAVKEGNEDEFFYFMEDGSIDNGFEVATMPFTFEWMNKNKKRFEPMFNIEKHGHGNSFSEPSCGMHIHVGRAGFVSDLHKLKFADLFYKNEEMVVGISRRRADRLESWAKTRAPAKVSSLVTGKEGMGRYYAINFCPENTIECRIFRGTLSPIGYFANMEFIEAAFQFSMTNGIRDMRAENFLRYAGDKRKLYPSFNAVFGGMIRAA